MTLLNCLFIDIYQLETQISVFLVFFSRQYCGSSTFPPDYAHLAAGEGEKQTMQHA